MAAAAAAPGQQNVGDVSNSAQPGGRTNQRNALLMGAGSGAFLLLLLGTNLVTGVWPRPWVFLEVIAALASLLLMYHGVWMLVFGHRLAPRVPVVLIPWRDVSLRFWPLFLGAVLAPLGLVLAVCLWKQSPTWATTCAVLGVLAGLVAYVAGRPWFEPPPP